MTLVCPSYRGLFGSIHSDQMKTPKGRNSGAGETSRESEVLVTIGNCSRDLYELLGNVQSDPAHGGVFANTTQFDTIIGM